MKSDPLLLSALLAAAVLGAGAGYGAWRFWLAPPPGPAVIKLMPGTPPAPPAELLGAPAPPFELPALDGQTHALAEWRGRVVLLNFWATWCEPCREEMPMLAALGNAYRARGFEVVGIAVDEPEAIRAFVRELALDFPILHGDSAVLKLSQRYGNRIGALPFTALVDRRGRIAYLKVGLLERQDVVSALEAVL